MLKKIMNMLCKESTSKLIKTTFFKKTTMRNENTNMKFTKPTKIKINSHFVSKEHKRKHLIHTNRGKPLKGV